MAENFDLIFGQNASQQYAWSDNDYQNGWETIGNIPPTAAQFDALQRRSDTKMKELNDELTPLVNANTTDNRQPATEYSEGTIKYTPLLPTGWFLECTVAGVTDTGEIVLPTPPAEKDTVADGTVTWTIRKMGSGSGGDGFAIIYPNGGTEANPANVTINSRYVESNPFPGYYVNCITEIYYNNQWGGTGDFIYTNNGQGTKCLQLNDSDIVVQTGSAALTNKSAHTGNPFGMAVAVNTAPCRVKVWKVGKIPTV